MVAGWLFVRVEQKRCGVSPPSVYFNKLLKDLAVSRVNVAGAGAFLVYRMLRYGQNFVEQGIHQYELKFRLRRIK